MNFLKLSNLVIHQSALAPSMAQKNFHFWILLFASLFLAALIISFALKIVTALLFLLFILVITPIIYGLLKSLLASDKLTSRSEKLKRRD
jgi:hypothetical protein